MLHFGACYSRPSLYQHGTIQGGGAMDRFSMVKMNSPNSL